MSGIKRQKSEHPNQAKNPATITYRLIREYKREKISEDNQHNYWVYWVVQWCQQPSPVWEKRRIYITKDGRTKTHKQGGLTLDDLKFIAEHQTEIVEDLQK